VAMKPRVPQYDVAPLDICGKEALVAPAALFLRVFQANRREAVSIRQ
jgi:hypothetical protein